MAAVSYFGVEVVALCLLVEVEVSCKEVEVVASY